GDRPAARQQEDGLHTPKEAQVGRPRQGAGESLPIVLVEAEFMGSPCSSHRPSVPRRAIFWKTFGYLLSFVLHGVSAVAELKRESDGDCEQWLALHEEPGFLPIHSS